MMLLIQPYWPIKTQSQFVVHKPANRFAKPEPPK